MPFDITVLTAKQRAFAEEYLVTLNARDSARRAGYAHEDYASELIRIPHVRAYIDYLVEERAARLHITQDDVVARLWAIASADVNELVEYRRVCCRFCHGEGHRYQWSDAEFERAKHEARRANYPEPEAPGGVGFDRTRDPNPECPECKGEGEGEVFAKDTRKASQTAKTLYAGAKVGRDGLEIKLHDQMRALEMLSRHLGMYKEKVEHSGEVTGPVLNLTLAAPPGVTVTTTQPTPPDDTTS